MIKIVYCGSSSACFELDGDTAYYSKARYSVLADGAELLSSQDTNVFSLFGLEPGRAYDLTVRFEDGGEESLRFTAKTETCCASVRDFGAAGDGVHEDTAAIQAGGCGSRRGPISPCPCR